MDVVVHIVQISNPFDVTGRVVFLCGDITNSYPIASWITAEAARINPAWVTCEDCNSTQGLLALRDSA